MHLATSMWPHDDFLSGLADFFTRGPWLPRLLSSLPLPAPTRMADVAALDVDGLHGGAGGVWAFPRNGAPGGPPPRSPFRHRLRLPLRGSLQQTFSFLHEGAGCADLVTSELPPGSLADIRATLRLDRVSARLQPEFAVHFGHPVSQPRRALSRPSAPVQAPRCAQVAVGHSGRLSRAVKASVPRSAWTSFLHAGRYFNGLGELTWW